MAEEDGGEVVQGEGQTDEIRAYEQAQQQELERQKKDQKLLKVTQKIFNTLYKNYPYAISSEISRKNRERLGFKDVVTLSYAEAPYPELLKQLARLTRMGLTSTSEGHFVDLGSGTGTMVFAAALYHDFTSVMGVEIQDDLHSAAKDVESIWKRVIMPNLSERKRDTNLRLQLGDCCYTDWSHADVVWCNATCFDQVMLDRIAARCADLKPGAFFLIVTKLLPNSAVPFFELVDTGSIVMNWGVAVVHYYKRNRIPPPSYIANKTDYINFIIKRRALPVFDPKRAKPLLVEEIEAAPAKAASGGATPITVLATGDRVGDGETVAEMENPD